MQAQPETSLGFVGTFPPTQCGLATFTAALMNSMAVGRNRHVGVVEVIGANDEVRRTDGPVRAQWRQGDARTLGSAIATLNGFEAVILQHEYGIYGGADGCEVLRLLDALTAPTVSVLHTVVREPTSGQRRVLEEVVDLSQRAVVMTESARRRLVDRFDVDESKIVVIPHGAHPPARPPLPTPDGRPIVLTWGLLGPGKGIEWAIDAMTELRDLAPEPRYIVAGETHPKVLATGGESYRNALIERARSNHVDKIVEFDGTYRDLFSLGRLIAAADVILLPYESTEQVTSGVLIEAVAAGKPVVATAFPHAVELLATGAGRVVPHGDARAMGRAVRSILTRPLDAAAMQAAARSLSGDLMWSSVGDRFDQLITTLLPHAVSAVA